METNHAIDLVREALLMAMTISAPILLVALVIGLLLGMLQSILQVQDATLSTVPKLLLMGICLAIVMPWMAERLVEYSKQLILDIPAIVSAR